MDLLPINKTLDQNKAFSNDPLCHDVLYMTLDFYKSIDFLPPWICYFAREDGHLVGSGGFKGKPIHGTVEIAYGTFEKYRKQGIGAAICKALVDLSLKTDPSLKVRARTLPEKNFSNRILEKNNFQFIGIVHDPEDGEVWEWEFKPLH
jgi:[ribosomal protein S5]-alanine N-acetyltransferase